MTSIEAIPFSKKFTRDEISDMLASRKMDAIIANFVMGWDSVTTLRMVDGELTGIKREEAGIMYVDTVPHYSTDISAAWEVADRINKMIDNGELAPENDYNYLTLDCVGYNTGYAASFDCIFDYEWFEDVTNYKHAARGETAPLAICRAALLSMLEE